LLAAERKLTEKRYRTHVKCVTPPTSNRQSKKDHFSQQEKLLGQIQWRSSSSSAQ
jgi:hypothetical protein